MRRSLLVSVIAFFFVLASCGGSTSSDAPANPCVDVGGRCASECAKSELALVSGQTQCPNQGVCCLPPCPLQRPNPNDACTAKGARCTYDAECTTAICIGGSWYLDVASCPIDAGSD
jgi:hypothetical protein